MSSLLQVNNTQKPEVWGKLVSINSNLNNVDLIHPIYEIGRNTSNKISIQDVRVSGIHCILRRNEQGVVTLEDCSSNGTFLEGQKIGKGNASVMASGRKFELLPATKISKDAMFGYTFSLYTPDVNANKRRREEQEERMNVEHKQIKPPKTDFETEKNKVECLICENYIYQCVTTVPCQHSFCGACYSDSSKKNPSKCPKCGNEVDELKRNKLIDDHVTEFLENYPQQERMSEELREMNKKNKYQKGFIFHRNEKMIEEPPTQNQQGSKNLNNMNLLSNGINGQISNKPNIVGLDTRKNNKIERYHQLISKYIVE